MKKIIGCIIMVAAIATLLSYLVMYLWNHVITALFTVPVVSFWQAAGLLILCKILFGGIRGGWGGHRDHSWKKEIKEKWHGMTPEEREKVKQEWRNRCQMWGKREE